MYTKTENTLYLWNADFIRKTIRAYLSLCEQNVK